MRLVSPWSLDLQGQAEHQDHLIILVIQFSSRSHSPAAAISKLYYFPQAPSHVSASYLSTHELFWSLIKEIKYSNILVFCFVTYYLTSTFWEKAVFPRFQLFLQLGFSPQPLSSSLGPLSSLVFSLSSNFNISLSTAFSIPHINDTFFIFKNSSLNLWLTTSIKLSLERVAVHRLLSFTSSLLLKPVSNALHIKNDFEKKCL